ncbi:heme-binding protein [Streptomyces mirabilis]|uniref:heme-binding protein n=1 Tax=Streptomyces mirabilis TaxID=68239 RepID=UPI00352F532C
MAEADWLVQAALAVGAERGFPPLAVPVVDVAGEVISLRPDDGGMPMTSRIAVAKRRTALIALKPSGQIDLPGGMVDSIQQPFRRWPEMLPPR